jgi:high-affinity nickel-transport protein
MGAGLHVGLVVTALGFGFRHGIDWDHIAALTDLTGTSEHPRRSMLLATLYAIGHAAVVFVLGVAAIVFAAQLPSGIDTVMERFVGITLIALGVWVFVSIARQGRDFRLHSRWMLLAAAARSGLARVRRANRADNVIVIEHEHQHAIDAAHHYDRELVHAHAHSGAPSPAHTHRHRHVATLPNDPFPNAGPLTALLIGAVHGIGAETPTQVLLFVTAAGVAGRAGGLVLLMAFIVGLLASNTAVAVAGTFGSLNATRNFPVYVTVSILTATFSLVIGSLFVVGFASSLPTLLGG